MLMSAPPQKSPTFTPFVPASESRPEFTLRALILGGLFAVLSRVPPRRQPMVEGHGPRVYPEGPACADVLQAGERGGSFASRVFLGLGLGGVYTLFQNDNLFALWPSTPHRDLDLGAQHLLQGGRTPADDSTEYPSVGYLTAIRRDANRPA